MILMAQSHHKFAHDTAAELSWRACKIVTWSNYYCMINPLRPIDAYMRQ